MKTPNRFRAAIDLLWNGVPTTATRWAEAYGSASSSHAGQSVTETTMLSLSTVWACSRLIAETISTLPLSLYEKRPDGGRRVAATHPIHTLIHSRPNTETTACVHWESTVAAMLLRGNARAERLEVGGRLVGLEFLAPSRLTVTSYPDGSARYLYREDNGRQREIPASKIFNIPGFSLDGKQGVSVVTYSANVMGNALAAEEASGKMFQNGLMPTTFFKLPQILRKEQREEFRASIDAISGAVNAGKRPVLEGGMDVGQIGINPNDAQLLESRAHSVEEICRWFRVPPHMVGHANTTVWGSGIEQQNLGFLIYTLRAWLTRIEQAINKDLLTPAEQTRYYAEFNVEGLLRGDSKARSEFYASALQNGYMNRNQVAAKENGEPIPGGDIYTVQSNLIPLDKVGQNVATTPRATP